MGSSRSCQGPGMDLIESLRQMILILLWSRYISQEKGPIQVHQTRVCVCPPKWPAGFYWYGGSSRSSERWVERLLEEPSSTCGGGEDDDQPSLTDSHAWIIVGY